MKRITIAFLDGDKRSTLAMIRSIGKQKQYRILVGGTGKSAFCRYSRYVDGSFLYKDPSQSYAQFVDSLQRVLDTEEPDYICPGSDLTLCAIYTSPIYESIKERLIAPPKHMYMQASDKKQITELAEACQVKTIPEATPHTATYPVVVKPKLSRFFVGDQLQYGFRQFVQNVEECDKAVEAMKPHVEPLIQEVISGKGYGVFAAAKDGKPIVYFAHERIREVPPGGGVSTLRRANAVHPALKEATEKIIRQLNWTGIMMVEFKGESKAEAYFMEVNARPWGSLDLAVRSGVDFPGLMIDLFVHEHSFEQLFQTYNRKPYKPCYSRWIIGELNYIRYVLTSARPFMEKLRLMCRVMKPHRRETYDTLRWTDPLPFIAECVNVIGGVRLKKGSRSKKVGGLGDSSKSLKSDQI
ncbi:ATP-grasp domain-containing protein [Lentibacillus saliphilus]|uniref:carboxylate--amine ligase n=1 Tax=Lentibacillus saliphilus TaxID=2737028 RepID=UPI001C2FC4C5|nr:ATP-grasp domain-containing protein [Lentibacillus saliphilus]